MTPAVSTRSEHLRARAKDKVKVVLMMGAIANIVSQSLLALVIVIVLLLVHDKSELNLSTDNAIERKRAKFKISVHRARVR